MNTAKDSAKV